MGKYYTNPMLFPQSLTLTNVAMFCCHINALSSTRGGLVLLLSFYNHEYMRYKCHFAHRKQILKVVYNYTENPLRHIGTYMQTSRVTCYRHWHYCENLKSRTLSRKLTVYKDKLCFPLHLRRGPR